MRFVGVLLSAGVTAALLFAVIISGCKEDDPGIVNVCIPPSVIRTSPMDSATNVPLHKLSGVTKSATSTAVKIITATFSRPMNPKTITSATFIVQQGTLFISGTVSYSDTTAVFIVPDGLGPNRTYTCTITTGAKDEIGTPLASNYIWTFTTLTPENPTLVAPVNTATNQPTNPILIWNSVPSADTYRLQVSTVNNFASTVYDDSTRTNTSQQLSGLTEGTTYYWRVNAKISGGTSFYSTIWHFTTIASSLAPILLAPDSAAQNQATSLTLSWLSSLGANTYRLQISTSSSFATTVYNDSTNTGTSQLITGLTVGTTYYWRVNAKNATGTSAYSHVWNFTTIAPGTPTLVSPLDGAVNQVTNPILVWNVVPGADTYRLQVSTTNNFATTLYNDSTRTSTSQQVSGLAVGTTYYWRVNSKISGGTSAYSTVWSFTTIASPNVPVLLSPIDSALNQPTSLTLSWLTSTGANTYRLQVSTTSNFASTVINDSVNTSTSQPITGLTVGTTYYWRVNAKNVAGTSAYSTVWRFTTIAPGTPTLVAPLDGAVDQAVNPTLIWNSVPGANTYRLQVSTTNNFATTVYNDSTLTSPSEGISGLAVGTTYYWRVNSKNSGVTSAYSNIWSFTTLAPPVAPVLFSPVDSAQNEETSLTLSWLTSAGANTYRLQVSTTNNFASTVINDSTNTGTSQPITGLTVGTIYYWRVNAKNTAGTSSYSTVWRFTTIAPGTPTLVAPLNESIDQAVNPTLIWNAIPTADTYRLQVSTTNTFATTVYNDSTITNTSQEISGLAVGTLYFWRVNSKISGGTSAYSNVWSFTTLAPPSAPSLSAPVDSMVNVETSLTLSWLASYGADTYRLQVSTSSNFASTVINDSTNTGTSQPITGLTVGTTYYWRVNAKNVAGTSVYSTVWRFTTIAPGTPTLVAPLDGAVDQAMNPTLIWDAIPTADTYRLQVSTTNNFATTVYNDSTRTNTSQQLSGLAVGTTYFWRVNSKISGGTSAYSSVWSFTTIGLPSAPVLFAPVDSAQNQATNLTLSWLASNGADTYRLQIDTNANFTTMVYNDSTNTGTSQPITGLAVGTTYYWRVNAKNMAGTSSYSTVWRFTTSVAALNPPILITPLDASVNFSTSPTLSWNATSGAVTYRLQVDTSTVFASTVFDDSTLTGLSQQITNLTYDMTYYWRVSATNSGGTSTYSTIWRFKIGPMPPPPIVLGAAERFGAVGGPAGVTNEGIFTQIYGSIGTTGASTLITGFHDGTAPPSNVFTETPLNVGAVRDTIYTATAPAGSVAGQDATYALSGAQTAFNYLAGLPPGSDPNAGELGGLTLYKGTYTSSGGTFKITSLDLTLDAQGDSNAQFIFQMASSLTVGAAGPAGARSVILLNGAQPKNVFWQVGAAATINAAGGGTMVGTIIAYSGVTFSTHDNVELTTLEGRALGLNASVTMVNTIINVPLP